MDGASKFVKGDAIASIIIALIKYFRWHDYRFFSNGIRFNREVARTFTLLTVGDGLVTQIPALLLSTSMGIVVTRAASESNLGQDLTRQVLAYPRALGIAAVVLAFLGLFSKLPTFPFWF